MEMCKDTVLNLQEITCYLLINVTFHINLIYNLHVTDYDRIKNIDVGILNYCQYITEIQFLYMTQDIWR